MTRILALLGPTATGKTAIAIDLAERRGIPIVSVDSMQVYRGLDIGTAKPTAAEQQRVPHRMIDLVEPEYEYSVAEFQTEARRLIQREEEVLIVGGSGLHFRSIVDPLEFPPTDAGLRAELEALENPVSVLVGADPGAGELVDLANPRRVVRALEVLQLTGLTPSARYEQASRRQFDNYVPLYEFSAVGLDPGPLVAERIRIRIEGMRNAGWWEEVEGLRGKLGRTARGAVGYRELAAAQCGHRDPETVWEDIATASERLVRRQRTYFRRDPRIRWIGWDADGNVRTRMISEAFGL